MFATLPMYDLPEARAATAAWWAGLARHLRARGVDGVPYTLSDLPDRSQGWLSPDLILSQTCGYPLTHDLAGKVRYVATPVYDAPGCSGTDYRSALVVRADSPVQALADLRGAVCAVNGTDSHSGYNVLRHAVAPLADGRAFFTRVAVTGSHRNSIAAVAAGEADMAAIDCVTFALISRYAPRDVAKVRVLAYSAPAPGLPYITSAGADDVTVATLRLACRDAVADPALADIRAALFIAGFAVLDDGAYDAMPAMEAAARARGYPQLA